jgi:hypothetical protein
MLWKKCTAGRHEHRKRTRLSAPLEGVKALSQGLAAWQSIGSDESYCALVKALYRVLCIGMMTYV